jgi:hypothetical protein
VIERSITATNGPPNRIAAPEEDVVSSGVTILRS